MARFGSRIMCRCGHPENGHTGSLGHCMRFFDDLADPFAPGAKWTVCPCPAFDDAVLPDPGARLVFGVHRMPSVDAETAEAWPPVATWASRVKAATTRRMKRV